MFVGSAMEPGSGFDQTDGEPLESWQLGRVGFFHL